MRNLVVVIPAFEPETALIRLVHDLRDEFRGIVVVDDGSRRSRDVFAQLDSPDNVQVLSHETNRGKGAALKTAFGAVLMLFPDALGVLTADADGQHLPKDILRVARTLEETPEMLALGVRSFGRDTPFRSRLGNLWTVAEFRLLTGTTVRDTQTGLRGIPLRILPKLLSVPGDRYDYEIRMLATAVLAWGGVTQVPIETVYAEGNRSSHFRPFADTIETQRALFAAALTERFGSRSPA